MKNKTSILLLFLTFLFVNVGNATAQQKHEYVDLDLPSGTLWATCDIGASNPWDRICDYFAWGEVMPKKDESWRTYKYSKDNTDKLTKYCIDANYGYNRFSDGRRTLEPSDDAATVNWGNEWRMPTKEEFIELINNCSIEYVSNYMGHIWNGIVVRSKKNPSKHIVFHVGSYWTSTISPVHEITVEQFFHFTDDEPEKITVGTYAERMSCGRLRGELTVDVDGRARCESFAIRAVRKNKSTSQQQTPSSNSSQTNTPSSSTTHKYVDLGLPSGTLWAITNVGASSPEDAGDYFAWGETTTKSKYDWSTYKYANGDYDKLTKYCNQSFFGNNGFTDSRTTLEKSDDVVYQKWGSDWCMPTQGQIQELNDKCTWTWTTLNGKKGYNVKGPNGKSIFLPAAGCKGRDGKTSDAGSNGYYWSSSLNAGNPFNARGLRFNLSSVDANGNGNRLYGNSVRPVRCKN